MQAPGLHGTCHPAFARKSLIRKDRGHEGPPGLFHIDVSRDNESFHRNTRLSPLPMPLHPSAPPFPLTGLPRLCFLSYRQIREFALPVVAEYAGRAEIEVVDGTFGGALAIARDRLERGAVDAFVSAGSNAHVLRTGLQMPVATIQLGGFDILQALIKARAIASRVGVVMYGQTIPELDAVKDLLNIEITQYAYQTPDDARQRFEQLRRDGFRVVVGSSLVVELAEEAGMHALLAYSLASIRQGFENALELARLSRLEAGRYEQLHGVLGHLQEAVLAVDLAGRVIALNAPMEAVLGLPRRAVSGRLLDDIAPPLSLARTLATGQEERQGVCHVGQREWLINRTLIRERSQVVGAIVTLYDTAVIQEADTALRSQRKSRQYPTARWTFGDLQGDSPAMVRARKTALRFARTDLTVLITGESGTGKELFAQAIHNASARSDRPFVAVNCAAVPENLLESELFGHEEGAFSGSRKGGKRGLLETAHTGTLFLDEIGDMPLALQTRLLRVLQERELTRVGGLMPIPVDLRVLAATHQPLAGLVAERRFRADLYYRLNILRLQLPPLRERAADIDAMACSIVGRCLRRLGNPLPADEVMAPLLARLRAHRWEGNVRELENLCERMAVFFAQYARPSEIEYAELAFDCPELFEGGTAPPLDEAARDSQWRAVLDACGGNRKEAARRLGISRSTLWRRMQAADDAPAGDEPAP